MIEHVHLDSLICLPGASDRLSQKTAFLVCSFSGDHEAWFEQCRPTLADWRCLLPRQGFFEAESPPANLADWLITLVLAIQREVYEPVWRGRVVRFEGMQMELALPYQRVEVLKASIQWALRYLWLWGNPDAKSKGLEAVILRYRRWLDQAQSRGLPPNSQRFVLSALARQWPVSVELGVVAVGWGKNRQRFDSSHTSRTSLIAARFAKSKSLQMSLLRHAHLPVPATLRVDSLENAQKAAVQLGWPVVVKPDGKDQGIGVTTGIFDPQSLQRAFEAAAYYSPKAVIVQKYVDGRDYRLLIVGGRLLAAAQRIPGGVVGDGRRTVAQLLAELNRDPRRGRSHHSLLIQIELDQEAHDCLAAQQLSVESIPAAGQSVALRQTANISTGGTAVDVTSAVHQDNRLLAERASRVLGLDIAGVDLLCLDISRSWREQGGMICEVNAQPGFRPHWLADPDRDLNGEVMERLLWDNPLRIPTAAITGTNGKTTTAKMLHRIWMASGTLAGVCTTQGTWIGDELVNTLNLSGLPGAKIILGDPSVEAAIFEMPRKGLIVFGHPCDAYDVGALLNIQHDHLGADGIETLEQMAQLKAQVLSRSRQAVVGNADDHRCLRVLAECSQGKRVILVSEREETPPIQSHLRAGGQAVFRAETEGVSEIVFAQGQDRSRLMPLSCIPATMNGLLRCNESNALFAAALAWAQRIEPHYICAGLASFENSLDQNPGRFNFIPGYPFTLILDFAHNPDGVEALCSFVDALRSRAGSVGRCHLVSLSIGNSHRDHLVPCAISLARVFSTFSLCNDADEVSAASDYPGDHPAAMMLACFREALVDQGVSDDLILSFPATKNNWRKMVKAALRHGLSCAQAGDIVVILAESDVLNILNEQTPV